MNYRNSCKKINATNNGFAVHAAEQPARKANARRYGSKPNVLGD